MVPPHGSAPIDESLQVLWVDGERAFCRASRPGSAGSLTTVLAVRPIAQHPPPFTLEQLAHEYALKDELDSAWAVRPLELMREDGRTTLVLEDPGGEPLEALLGTPMELGRFLRLAIRITMALGRLHRGGLVHRDLKPTHILVNCADGQVRVTGFGLASRLPQERQSPEPPERIAGSLAYMAPEQTGRMNRSVDTRSDLYALGVTLYQTLTGTLPFTASDPMEWVQSHIARKPVPPSERITHLPAAVSQIIMKLLAKTAEDRYQSAAGLESDLRRCLAAWNAERRIDDFPLGQHDTPDRLLIPEKLYGREHEVEVLLAAFDRVVKDGAPELVLVAGGSGIGKSAVVGELHKELVPRHGLFASGKFDQHQRDIPYSALVQAFQSVVRPLLGKGDTELAIWRDALLEALGPNARLMTELLPELKRIIGDQPPVPDLEPQQAQRRFQLVFCRFIGVFAGPDRPLALFLDDLQWLDPATLELLEDLLTRSDLHHLMLIGAYRDSEVDAAHPLTRKLDAIRRVGAQVQEIRLAPLPRHGVAQLIADALRCEPERAANLAQLLHEKTAGNPYFVIHFLHALTDEDLLRFDRSAARWTWDLERIRARGFTDDVADLMLGKLRRLPAATQGAMRQFACLGNKVSIATLNVVQGGTEAPLHAALWEAARAGLVLREEGAYLFAHDRVQEGAYALIPQGERPAEHLRIGRRLAAGTPPDTIAESVFEIVGQLNAGAALISAEEERVRLAELNLLAGQRAKASCAYASALTYLEAGRALLPHDCWERCGPLTFALELHRAECEFLTGASAEAAARLAAIAGHAPALPDLAAVTRLRVELFTTIGLSEQAVEVCLDYLRQAGVTWSTHPTQEAARQEHDRIWQLLGDRPIEALLDLPGMADPGACGTMDVLTAFVTPASFIDENLRCLVICRMANLSLEYGNSDASCFAFVLLGAILGQHFGAYQAAYRFGQLGLELEERRGPSRFAARVRMWFACLVSPWARHVRTSRPILRQALDAASRIGDLGYAVYSRSSLLTNLLASGDPLADVQREAEAGLAIARQLRLGLAIDFITAHLRLARTLRGQTPDLAFNDAEFDEERFEERLGADPRLSLATCWYWIRKLQARFFAGAYASAIAAASKAERLLRTSAPGGGGRPSSAAPAMGGELPGELRGPRCPGQRGDCPDRRPRR
jgi:predicted ATPase